MSEVTSHRRYTIKKTHPNLTAQVENIGGKINYRATFTYHITIVRTRWGKVRPAEKEKRCPSIQILSATYMPTYLQKMFFEISV